MIIDLGYLGYLATVTAKNESFNNESLGFARKAIQLIESGKAPANWAPFKSKDDTLAYLYNAIGRLTLKSNSPEALTALIKAAQFESEVKEGSMDLLTLSRLHTKLGPTPSCRLITKHVRRQRRNA